ncbi:DNA helicase [Streptomyces sp. XY431]|uniref:UvrD-helicase domain-containing protein n=1 Tax=Streptomyces sp. XY431 TaxID=1415562 RepID=UPI0006AEE4D1|nr:UvrD-helicase domain-containing protein [Streptomyces sp. XY431]KOV12134.1 DNA helicase [Streptomyces sp. XY431]
MTARLTLYRKAEDEIYKLDRLVKAKFYDFCHIFRHNPHHPGLRLKKLKGDSQIHSARIDQSYRALLTPTGTDANGTSSWLVLAVRHRRDVYQELEVAVNRVTGALEFVDLAVVGDSALRRAGITLTPVAPDPDEPPVEVLEAGPLEPDTKRQTAQPLLGEYDADLLRELGVAEQLIPVALVVVDSDELDRLLENAPLLSKDVLTGLASGMPVEDVRQEILAAQALDQAPDPDDFAAALARTEVTTVDDDVRAKLEEGDFRAWKVFLHPSQARVVEREYSGPTRVSGGPGTGKTIVALHRVKYLVNRLPPGQGKPILLTTYTKNLTTDLRQRLASLLEPEQLARVEVAHIDQLAAKVLGENAVPGRSRQRITGKVALDEMRQLLAELGEQKWEAEFLLEEWEQVILGQAEPTRSAYFQARRAGRGRGLTRPERNQVWRIVDRFTARLDDRRVETWSQAAERAARYEIERARGIEERRKELQEAGKLDSVALDDRSGARSLVNFRYRHIVVDEAQDLSPAHWKMLRAMADPKQANDLFIAGDTHQRIYDNQVALGSLGIHIRGRSSRLTLSYRTTKEILAEALRLVEAPGISYDDLDDGTDTLAGYRSVLHGPAPELVPCTSWDEELNSLAETLGQWRAELSLDDRGAPRDPAGRIAVCVADRELVNEVRHRLGKAGVTSAELSKDGPVGDGIVHVGTMHRFKGLEYQRLAIVAAADGVLPRRSHERLRSDDLAKYNRELRKARSLLFVAATRARDTLRISWHGSPSPFLKIPVEQVR